MSSEGVEDECFRQWHFAEKAGQQELDDQTAQVRGSRVRPDLGGSRGSLGPFCVGCRPGRTPMGAQKIERDRQAWSVCWFGDDAEIALIFLYTSRVPPSCSYGTYEKRPLIFSVKPFTLWIQDRGMWNITVIFQYLYPLLRFLSILFGYQIKVQIHKQ